MERGDIDGYITLFEQLVRHAGLQVSEPLVLDNSQMDYPMKCMSTSLNLPCNSLI
jgi:hypothetical protein